MSQQSREMIQQSKAALAHMLEHRVRFEIFPLPDEEREKIDEQVWHLPKGAKITVTCPSKEDRTDDIEVTLRLAEHLMRLGFLVVPHIGARSIRDEAHLADMMEHLANIGLKEIFVPGGDRKEPLCERFGSAFELLTAIKDLGYEFDEIGITSYPEGHPDIDDEILLRALQEKELLATYMVTQLSLKPRVTVNWIAQMRELGIALPVYIGIPGAMNKFRLARMCQRIGVSGSRRFLRKNRDFAKELSKPGVMYQPDKILRGLEPYLANPDYNIVGFHINTFNQIGNTESWRNKFLVSLAPKPQGLKYARGFILAAQPTALTELSLVELFIFCNNMTIEYNTNYERHYAENSKIKIPLCLT